MAIWFHEYDYAQIATFRRILYLQYQSAIYEPEKGDNEEQSAELWNKFASEASFVR